MKSTPTSSASEGEVSALLRAYATAYKATNKVVTFIQILSTGFWLGVLPRHLLHHIDEQYYDGESMYHTSQFNRSGLFPWEEQMIQIYFGSCASIRVASAGGGRELYALHQRGYAVDGFECHPELAAHAKELFRAEQMPIHVQLARRDECLHDDRTVDGFILGWSAYALIQGKRTRVHFLRQAHAQLQEGGPLLISFFRRPRTSTYFRMIAVLANAIRFLLRRERVELGDNLRPNYVHHFTEEELRCELTEAGFELVHYGVTGTAHAVAIKRAA